MAINFLRIHFPLKGFHCISLAGLTKSGVIVREREREREREGE